MNINYSVEMINLQAIEEMEVYSVAAIWPKLVGEPLTELANDIFLRGIVQPLVVFDGKLLDGQNRLAAVVLANKSYDESDRITSLPIRYFEGTEEEADSFVNSVNDKRRHLAKDQLLLVADGYRQIVAERARLRMLAAQNNNASIESEAAVRTVRTAGVIEEGKTRDIVAKEFGVSIRGLESVNRLRKAANETVQDPNTSDPEAKMPTPRAVKAVNALRAIENGKETVNAAVEKVFKAKDILSSPDDDTPLIIAQKKWVQAKLKVKEGILEFHKVDDSDTRLEFILDALDVLKQTAKETFGQWEDNEESV